MQLKRFTSSSRPSRCRGWRTSDARQAGSRTLTSNHTSPEASEAVRLPGIPSNGYALASEDFGVPCSRLFLCMSPTAM
jgi:hypothetical protein